MKTIIILLAVLCSMSYKAQENVAQEGKNIIKTNVTGYFFRNLNVTYERSLNKTFSISVGLSTVTKGGVPGLKNFIGDTANNEIADVEFSSTAFTIEPRIYLGKKQNSGFYFAPYYRYTKMKLDHFSYNFSYTKTDNTERDIPLNMTGDISANSFGLMIGSQWYFGKKKNWVLDWWIVGGHYGFGSGDINGVSNQTLDAEDRAALNDDINDLEIPVIEYKAEVHDKGVRVKVDGPWAGLRSGLSFGYRF